jgi:hypothetical protein
LPVLTLGQRGLLRTAQVVLQAIQDQHALLLPDRQPLIRALEPDRVKNNVASLLFAKNGVASLLFMKISVTSLLCRSGKQS